VRCFLRSASERTDLKHIIPDVPVTLDGDSALFKVVDDDGELRR
jgi:hypothetical protein